jgi:hypothetical protein
MDFSIKDIYNHCNILYLMQKEPKISSKHPRKYVFIFRFALIFIFIFTPILPYLIEPVDLSFTTIYQLEIEQKEKIIPIVESFRGNYYNKDNPDHDKWISYFGKDSLNQQEAYYSSLKNRLLSIGYIYRFLYRMTGMALNSLLDNFNETVQSISLNSLLNESNLVFQPFFFYNTSLITNQSIFLKSEYQAESGVNLTLFFDRFSLTDCNIIFTVIDYEEHCGMLCGRGWTRIQFVILDGSLNIAFILILYQWGWIS